MSTPLGSMPRRAACTTLSLIAAATMATIPLRTQTPAFLETARLSSPAANPNLDFGRAVATDGDTVVVSEPGFFNAPPTLVGVVHVFERAVSGGAPVVPAAVLSAASPVADRSFGWAVAIDGDTILVGGPQTDGRGAVFVYQKPVGGWTDMTETAVLTASDPTPGDGFGFSVALDGTTAVVGSPLAQTGTFSFGGKAYVFERPPAGWSTATENATLQRSGVFPYSSTQVGRYVAIDGDTIALGSAVSDAFVFQRTGATWQTTTETARIRTTQSTDTRVAMSGTSLAVDGSGVVEVYARPAAGWATPGTPAILTTSAPGPRPGTGLLGGALAARDDAILVASGCGAAYVFAEPPGGWAPATEDALLHISSRYVESLAAAGDVMVAGSQAQQAAYVFTSPMVPLGAPTISGLTPASLGDVTCTTSRAVQVSGTDFTCSARVDIGTVHTQLVQASGSALVFDVPNGLPVGNHPLTVTTSAGTSNAMTLTIVDSSPVVTAVTPATVPNHSTSPTTVSLQGSNLDCVTSVVINGTSLPFQNGTFTVPNGFEIGTHPLRASNGFGTSDPVNFTVAGTDPPFYSVPPLTLRGSPAAHEVFTDRGWVVLYFLQAGPPEPSVLPGIASFEIGAGFTNFAQWAAALADAGGDATLQLNIPVSIPVSGTWSFEVLAHDPINPTLPLSTSGAQATIIF